MQGDVKAIPDGFRNVTPFLVIKDAKKTLDFYEKGLGAQIEFAKFSPDGRLMHGVIRVGDSAIMLGEESADHSCPARAPSPKVTSAAIWLYVNNVDELYNQAVSAGAKTIKEPTDEFWGDRLATIADPAGHQWHIGTHTEDVSPEELDRRASTMYQQAITKPKMVPGAII